MMYSLTTIDEFVNILQNKDTEMLKVASVTSKNNGNNYKIINYNKNLLGSDNVNSIGLFRSVILNSANRLICFSPPKSIQSDTFIQKYPELNENIIAQEFIEGTMINVFWDPTIGLTGGWEIATRNTIGATSKFFKSENGKTFRDMFMETAASSKLILDSLNRNYCYSFVLQHPENRIVVPFKEPQLYLVALYYVYSHNYQIQIIPIEPEKLFDFQNVPSGWEHPTIKFPQVYKENTYSELIDKYASTNTDYKTLGVVIYNKHTLERTKIRNPVYEEVRHLRGNQPKLQFQYLSLRKEGKVKDFLKFYPENVKAFSNFRDQVHLFTNTLHTNYISCYVKKEKPLKEFPEQYRTHMFNIHKKYMSELKEQKMYVNNTIVIQYVNDMAPTLLMYCLNFHMRKRNIEINNTNTNM
jgi:hypothetical protein